MGAGRHAHALSIVAIVSLAGVASASGCGSEGAVAIDGASSGGSSSSGASGSSGASASSSSSSSSSGGPDSSIPDVTFQYDAPLRPESGDACAQSSAIATLKPLDMFVMLDRSGSMNAPQMEMGTKGDCNVGQNVNSRWCRAINALSSYFNSPAATGHAAALQFFMLANGQCNGTGYNVSFVPGAGGGYVTLPSTAFDATLNFVDPQGLTPTEGALRGIVGYTGLPANQRAGRITIGVLITDGDPTVGLCDANLTNLSAILQNHYNATGIRTFVVGMTGATFANLESIAAGGNAPLHADTVGAIADACGNGAGPCRHWNVGDGNGNALAEAMKQIQGAAIACQYTMPTPSFGVVNPNDVVVEYLQNGVPPAKKLTRVSNAAACVADGWYYDNNASPTTIHLCGAQCTSVQADVGAKINVQLGCLGG